MYGFGKVTAKADGAKEVVKHIYGFASSFKKAQEDNRLAAERAEKERKRKTRRRRRMKRGLGEV